MVSSFDLFDGTFDRSKVLITGHSGFKGSWLTFWLRGLNATVVGLSDRKVSDPCMFDILGLGEDRE